eukprot:2359412-Prymnesium_polylepis.1
MASLNTAITKLLNIRHPIIQGGMHHVGFAPLAAAVANAGGLGLVTALTQPSAEMLRQEIRAAQGMLRDDCSGAVGVNLTILPTLAKGVDYHSYVKAIIDEGVRIVETAGRPPTDFIDEFKASGVKIIHKCVTTRHAKSAERMGADAISLDGFDCAGHPGEGDMGNWILQAMGARELSCPYVASGGVGNGRQLAAALALGASGVNMGTRFMATQASGRTRVRKRQPEAENQTVRRRRSAALDARARSCARTGGADPRKHQGGARRGWARLDDARNAQVCCAQSGWGRRPEAQRGPG